MRSNQVGTKRSPLSKATAFRVCALATAVAIGAQTQELQVPPGVSLSHFTKVDVGVYGGSKPRTDQDYEFLKSQHIRYILNARFLPFLSGSERRKAKRYGITLLSVPMNASPIPPREKHVDRILLTLRNKEFQPIYLHCVLGRDRTGLIVGLYRIYFLSVSRQEAWKEMLQNGFHTWWFVAGLGTYFDNHASSAPPVAASGQ